MNRRQALVPANRAAKIAVLLLLAAGCQSSGPAGENNRGPVSGKVTLNGQPLPGGSITFLLPSDQRYRATALIGRQGEFSVADAPLGKVEVEVETLSYNAMHPGTPFQIPAKYGRRETSGLTIEVGPGSREGVAVSCTPADSMDVRVEGGQGNPRKHRGEATEPRMSQNDTKNA